MVVLMNKLPNFDHKSKKSKLDKSESIALQSFESNISEKLHKLLSDGWNDSSISLSWYIPCLKYLEGINRAFAKLVKELDYPVTKWKGKLCEDYFSHTLNMLDTLNLITCLISQVGISRLSLTHALSLITTSPCSAIQYLTPIIPKKVTGLDCKEMVSKFGSFNCGKEMVIHEAMMKMRSVDMLVLEVLLCGLCGDKNELNWGQFLGFNLGFGHEIGIVKEIKQVNQVVERIEASLVGANKSNKGEEEAQELKWKLSQLESLTEMVGKEVNCFFSQVLARRNDLIHCFRLPMSA